MEKSLFVSFNAGRADIAKRASRATIRFAEVIHSEDISKLLITAARSIANAEQAHIVRVVKSAMTASMRAGDTAENFLKRLSDVLGSAGITIQHPGRVKTIFETSMATSYNSGRMSELSQLKDVFPWWIYYTRDDAHVRPNHFAMHKFVAPADARVWRVITPPNGFNCRCVIDGLTRTERGKLKGFRTVLPLDAFPDPGFKQTPTKFLRGL